MSESEVCGSGSSRSSRLCGKGRRMQVFFKHSPCHLSRGGGPVGVDLTSPTALVGKQCFDSSWK